MSSSVESFKAVVSEMQFLFHKFRPFQLCVTSDIIFNMLILIGRS